jgi:hypothetical protein
MENWTMNKAYLFVRCMSKIQECVVWFGKVNSENLNAFYQLFLILINFYLVYYFVG